MSDFSNNKIRRLDGTVLLVFAELMRLRKAADVAANLGLTNSAISHALRRLRDVFEDDLFIRRPHGLEPTAFAIEIEPAITRALAHIQDALDGPVQFDPSSAKATLRLAAADYEVATVVPDLLADLLSKAHGLDVSIMSMDRDRTIQALKDGELDLAFGFFPGEHDRLVTRELFLESYLVAGRKDRFGDQDTINLDAYLACDHVLVSQDRSMRGIVDDGLAQLGRSRRVRLSVPSFFPALSIAAQHDMLVTMPARMITRHAARFDLTFTKPPVAIRAFPLQVAHHQRDERGAMLHWVLSRLQAIMAKQN